MAHSNNENPNVVWSDFPGGTKFLVLLFVDDKVPSVFTDTNKENVSLPKDLLRMDFYHWVPIDINPAQGEVKEAEDSNAVVESGKAPGQQSYGISGVNLIAITMAVMMVRTHHGMMS